MTEGITDRATPKSLRVRMSGFQNPARQSVEMHPLSPQTFDRLLREIPAIQQMQKAQDETSNPALKTRAARLVFEGLESSEKDAVREFFREVRKARNRLYATMGEGPILPKSHPNPDQASAAAFQEQQSQMSKLNVLCILSEATRPASQEQRIAETVASLKEDPAGTIGSGIRHVTESALASCARRLGLPRFLSSSHGRTQ